MIGVPQNHRQKMKESVSDLERSGRLESTVYQDDDQELIFSVRNAFHNGSSQIIMRHPEIYQPFSSTFLLLIYDFVLFSRKQWGT